ncbi:lipoyl(octanoyl) transferase LipB [Asanoa sp. NPDC049518]|uniref:lipoyl(octanoyl) transferase LipB n=1 Tax=unclassified Asanoa TaxID=2685164 RepID=UPI00342C4E50
MTTSLTAPHRVDLGEVPYEQAVDDMRGWVEQRRAGAAPDRLFLLTHPPVITYGRHTPPEDLPADSGWLPVVAVDRGGYATYHGPGQLVGYLVMNLRERGPADVVRWLENALIEAIAELGFATVRRDTPKGADSLVGVWTPDHAKVASIGMRIGGGITSHGFALNIDPDLTVFDRFTACRLDGVRMTSLREIAETQGRALPSEATIRDAVAKHLGCR